MVWSTESPCVQPTLPYLPELSKPFCDSGATTYQRMFLVVNSKVYRLTTMQIDHDLQTSATRPVKSFAELVIRSLYVWLAISRDYTPVSDWDTHVVQTCLGHLIEVVLCNPGIPVVLQCRLGSILAKNLCIRPLILRCIALENAWGDPRLEDEPSTCVYATNFLAIVVKGRCSLGELLCFSARM